MNFSKRKKLIENVRKYKCIYHPEDKNYKNADYKALVWEKISREINTSGEIAKKSWRVMRDSYMKYKRNLKGKTGSERKTVHFMWSEQLSFLNESLEPGSTASKASSQPASSGTQNRQPPRILQSPPRTPPLLPQTPPPQPQTPPLQLSPPHSEEYHHRILRNITTPFSRISPPPLSPLSPSPSTLAQLGQWQSSSRLLKRKDPCSSDCITDNIINYLESKKKRSYDGVDHLFLSYAHTFKQLSVRKQAQLKIQLATLFSEAELSDISERDQSPVYSPMSPSDICDSTDVPSFKDVFIPEDLSISN